MIKRNSLFTLITLVTLASASRGAFASWTLLTADFKEQTGLTVNTWDAGSGLSVTDTTGKLNTMATRDVLSLNSGRKVAGGGGAPGGGAGWRLTIRNGDVLYGKPAGVSGQSLKFTTPELGTIAVPLKLVADITSLTKRPGAQSATTQPVPAKGAPDQDVVYLANHDTLQGLLIDFAEKLQIAVAARGNATSSVEANVVDRVVFAGMTPPRSLPPLSARITFTSGSVLTVPLDKQKSFSWTINDLTLRDPAGQECKASADSIVSIDVGGGRVVCLSDLDPVKDDQTTLMGTHWDTQVNKNVLGDPLNVEKRTYSRGLGVHVRSHLTYALDGSFETFKLRVGLDDAAAPLGAADVSVWLDGKLLWQAQGLQTGAAGKGGVGQISGELALPIKGGKRLELRADPALGEGRDGKIDVLGRVDWLDVALVRP